VNKLRFLSIVIFFLLPALCWAITIKCNNIEYAGQKLNFYRFADPISGEKELVFTLQFDANGKCSADIKNTKTIYAFSDFGIYRGMLLLAPKTNIELQLPPKREKSFANQKNPYFEPASFWFISTNKNQLNDNISKYDQTLNQLTNKHFNELYFSQSKAVYDSVLAQVNNLPNYNANQAFDIHKKLKEQYLKADIFRLQSQTYSEIFNQIAPEYWTHQAFISLFEKAFDNQLSFSAKAIGGKKYSDAVQKNDIKSLLQLVEEKYKVSAKMSELVLLKMLHDGFYSGYFSQNAIKQMVASPFFSNNSNAYISTAAKNILRKFSFLQKGSVAPSICLNDLNGKQQCSNQNNSKFKYFVFADVETNVCKEHLKYLNRINELFGKHLDIYIILRNSGHFLNSKMSKLRKQIHGELF
jgi:hypothetical protein